MAMSALSRVVVLDWWIVDGWMDGGCWATMQALPRPVTALAKETVRMNSRRVGRPAAGGDCSEYASHGSWCAVFPLTPALSPSDGERVTETGVGEASATSLPFPLSIGWR